MLLQVEYTGKMAEAATNATNQLVTSSAQETFLVQLLFWAVLILSIALSVSLFFFIKHLIDRNKELQGTNETLENINRYIQPRT